MIVSAGVPDLPNCTTDGAELEMHRYDELVAMRSRSERADREPTKHHRRAFLKKGI